MNLKTIKHLLFLTLFFATQHSIFGQLDITFPVERAVFQRDLNNQGTIHISGSIAQRVDSIQAKLLERKNGNQEIAIDWQNIDNQSGQGFFMSELKVKGGWYRLQLRAFLKGEVVAENEVARVGVGEVFVISGQSNAQGVPNYGGTGAADDRVNCANFHNGNYSLEPQFPLLFSQLSTSANIGPMGLTPWIWGEVGDSLVNRLGVPVLFFNSALTGTLSYNWWQSSREPPQLTLSAITSQYLPLSFPYQNLRSSLQLYASLLGVRAVLWHQGETDTSPGVPREQEIYDYYKDIIKKTRDDYGKNVAWMFSKVSYSGGFLSDEVIGAQTRIINEPGFNIYEGPFTDNLQIPRPDGVHFQNVNGTRGLGLLAGAWLGKLNSEFFAMCQPIIENPLVPLNLSCANNTQAKISVPDSYTVYRWNDGTGGTEKFSSNGTFGATLKDQTGNFKLSNTLNLNAVKYSNPSPPEAAKTLLCPAEALSLTTGTEWQIISWSSGESTPSIQVNKSGNYSYLAANSIGCEYHSADLAITSITEPDSAKAPNIKVNESVFSEDTSLFFCHGTEQLLNSVYQWDSLVWSDGEKLFSRTVDNSGELSFYGYYGPGCKTAKSVTVSFEKSEILEPPTIEPFGFLGLTATTTASVDSFYWHLDGKLIGEYTKNIKPEANGNYTVLIKQSIGNNLICSSELSEEFNFKYEVSDETAVIVYPKPTSGIIYLETSKKQTKVKIFVYGVDGSLVGEPLSIPVWEDRLQYSVSGLAPGVYIISIQSDQDLHKERIFVR
ncbi:MAG: T9SS type A sorting domain-containing protein [Cytophagales bacterium]|nr:T9SS type A sorting domain-containing protein [Cytophagales bacterium]